MKFGRSRHTDRVLDVEITPMIDVVFLLIIFFMVTAQFAKLTRAELDLPQQHGEQEQAPEEAGLVINILADGQIVVGERRVELDELLLMVEDEINKQPGRDARKVKLLIRADRGNDTSRLNQILIQLQLLGVGAARLATEVPQ